MQKLFQEEQERILREREQAQRQRTAEAAPKGTGLVGRLFAGFKRGTNAPAPIPQSSVTQNNQIEDAKVGRPEPTANNDSNYLLSTNTKQPQPAEDAKLIDFGEDEADHKATDVHKQKSEEKEVPMKLEEKDLQDDEETKRSETETVNEDRLDEMQDNAFRAGPRQRSDSLTSTSTTRMYSYSDFNDFMNIDELHKFFYKCGAMLVNQRGKMEEWIDWMQRTLAEYYVYCQVLYKQAKDVEILKDFLSQKLQKTKYKLDQVTNEKEDLIARQEAEDGIKEYLAKQMQELNIKNVEKTHELVLIKQKLSE